MKMKTITALAASIAVIFALVSVTLAHHSQSEYDSREKVEVEGTMSKLEWKSPHAWIHVDVTDAKGEKVTWHFELPSPNTLMRRGWSRDSLKIGDRVKVTGSPARNYPDIAVATSIRDASGKALFTGVTEIYEPEPESKTSK